MPLAGGLTNRTVTLAARLDIVRVDPRRSAGREASLVGLFAAVVVDVLDVERMDVAWQVTQDREADVNEEVCGRSAHYNLAFVRGPPTHSTSCHRPDSQRRDCETLATTAEPRRWWEPTQDGDEDNENSRNDAHGDGSDGLRFGLGGRAGGRICAASECACDS